MAKPHFFSIYERFSQDQVPWKDVRKKSLTEVADEYGTIGLYSRLQSTLDETGLINDPKIKFALPFALEIHKDDSSHAHQHLLRVALLGIEMCNFHDADFIAACLTHDTVEDHIFDILPFLGSSEQPVNEADARSIGKELLISEMGAETTEIIYDVTNVLKPKGLTAVEKRIIYEDNTRELLSRPSSKGSALKTGCDFLDNTSPRKGRSPEKEAKLDFKYIRVYPDHMISLFEPDSLISGNERTAVLDVLSKNYISALGRLATNNSDNERLKEISTQFRDPNSIISKEDLDKYLASLSDVDIAA
jgi:hypothetical protein